MEIEHEVLGIEELFLEGKDKKVDVIIDIPDRGRFKAIVEPVTYGQVKKMERWSEKEIEDYILSNHLYKADGENLTNAELDLLPAGVLKAIAEKIMSLSGLDLSDEDVKRF